MKWHFLWCWLQTSVKYLILRHSSSRWKWRKKTVHCVYSFSSYFLSNGECKLFELVNEWWKQEKLFKKNRSDMLKCNQIYKKKAEVTRKRAIAIEEIAYRYILWYTQKKSIRDHVINCCEVSLNQNHESCIPKKTTQYASIARINTKERNAWIGSWESKTHAKSTWNKSFAKKVFFKKVFTFIFTHNDTFLRLVFPIKKKHIPERHSTRINILHIMEIEITVIIRCEKEDFACFFCYSSSAWNVNIWLTRQKKNAKFGILFYDEKKKDSEEWRMWKGKTRMK